VEGARVVDYVSVVNAGDQRLQAGDHIEKSEAEKPTRVEGAPQTGPRLEPFCSTFGVGEDRHVIAAGHVELDDKGRLMGDLVNARMPGNFVLVTKDEVDYVERQPQQLGRWPLRWCRSWSTTIHTRADGRNMQRQSFPLAARRSSDVGTEWKGDRSRLRSSDPRQAQWRN